MRITINAVGRMKAGPERELVARYVDRLTKIAPALGMQFAGIDEIAESRARAGDERRRDEAERIVRSTSPDAFIVALDEHGRERDSAAFADIVMAERDGGRKDFHLVVGGADGHGDLLLSRAALTLSFGRMTWPHQLVRILAAEQLYRAATILSGHPYHRS